MKQQTMGTKKRTARLNIIAADITGANFNWDSFETMAAFYTEEIKKVTESLNQLSIMDDARLIINLCGKIKLMKEKLRRRW
jgi:hypothetical protein